MAIWKPTMEYQQAVAANIEEHAEIAMEYEKRTRQLATDPALWRTWYAEHLRLALGEIRVGCPGQEIFALDACGGTGKTAFFLRQQGVTVTLCDVSREMTDVYAKICDDLGIEPHIELDELARYLSKPSTPTFHLITLSSALHHIADFNAVLRLLISLLQPGGFIHTAWDPLPRSSGARVALKLEYCVDRMLHPMSALRGVRRRIQRFSRRRTGYSILVNHEFHQDGMDDGRLIRDAEALGLLVRIHHRNPGGSLSFTKPLWRIFGDDTSSSLLLPCPSTGSSS